MKLLVFNLVLLTTIICYANGECCGAYTIEYILEDADDKCDVIPGGERRERLDNDGVFNDILAKLARRRLKCRISVCYDGQVHEGSYCATGRCDMFGCNCDGACFTGNPAYPMDPHRNFMDRYGRLVKKAILRKEYENWLPA